MMSAKRLDSVDFLRGLAILLMVMANSAPYLLSEPYPYLLRFLSSLAAPLFIFLSGFSLAYTIGEKPNYLSKCGQALQLLLSAALLDILVWGIYPFQTFDVLYTIAIGMLLNVVMYRFNVIYSICLIPVIIISGIYIRQKTVYRFEIEELFISENLSNISFSDGIISIKRMLSDGWFPTLPWLSLSLLGSVSARKLNWVMNMRRHLLKICIVLFGVSCYFLFHEKSIQSLRDGYLELFYPPTLIFLLTAFFFVMLMFSAIRLQFNKYPVYLNWILRIGKQSLFVYLAHSIVIAFVFERFLEPGNPQFFVGILLLFYLILFLVVFGLQELKKRNLLVFLPSFIRQLLGIR